MALPPFISPAAMSVSTYGDQTGRERSCLRIAGGPWVLDSCTVFVSSPPPSRSKGGMRGPPTSRGSVTSAYENSRDSRALFPCWHDFKLLLSARLIAENFQGIGSLSNSLSEDIMPSDRTQSPDASIVLEGNGDGVLIRQAFYHKH